MPPETANDEFDIRLKTAIEIISRLNSVGFEPLYSRLETDAFCQRNRLHSVQLYMNEDVLELARSTLDSETAYAISDVFLLQFFLFSINGVPLILGPYCPEHLTESGAAAVIRQYSLSELDAIRLLTYCGTYPSISENTAHNIVKTLIHTVYPQEPSKNLRRISGGQDSKQNESMALEMRANHNTLIERRYVVERQMMDDIMKGDASAAVHHMHMLEKDVSYLRRAVPTFEGAKMGAAIARTAVRFAAQFAGLPALVVDRLTSKSTEEIYAARDEQTIFLSKEKLIRNVCEAIQEARKNQYSALVQNTLYYLENEYRNEINIERLSAEFGVSANHLIASFKKEIGITPNAYLGKVRMKKAADQLKSGQMTVSDVSVSVGINDPNYFVKLFKKEYGETPTVFRKRHII